MRILKTATTLIFVFLFFIVLARAQSLQPPSFPTSFYGTVTIGGQPAPIGIIIVATVDAKEEGSLTITEQGRYGGPNGVDQKLLVSGFLDTDQGKEIIFFINGQEADQSGLWQSGEVFKLDLSTSGKEPASTTPSGGSRGSRSRRATTPILSSFSGLPPAPPVTQEKTSAPRQAQEETGLEGITGAAVREVGESNAAVGWSIVAVIVVAGVIIYTYARKKK